MITTTNGKTKKTICDGLDPMDALCAQLTIVGKPTKINSEDDDDERMKARRTRRRRRRRGTIHGRLCR